MIGTVTNEWKYNGTSSFKFISETALCNFRIDLNHKSVGDLITASFNYLNPDDIMVIKLYQLNGNNVLNAQYINLPSSNETQTCTISTTTLENITSLRILIESTNNIGQVFFIDNIALSKR